jgi:hypothetical protein
VGAIPGVGVEQEHTVDGYLRGQVWNRPQENKKDWVMLRIDHDLTQVASYVPSIDYVVDSGEISETGGHIIPAGIQGIYEQRIVLQGEIVRVYPITAAEATQSTRTYDFLDTRPRLQLDWRYQSVSLNPTTLVNTTVIGFPLNQLIGEDNILIELTGRQRTYIDNDNPPVDDVYDFWVEAEVSVQICSDFTAEIDVNSAYLAESIEQLCWCEYFETWYEFMSSPRGQATRETAIASFVLSAATSDPVCVGQLSNSIFANYPPPPTPPWSSYPVTSNGYYKNDSGLYINP